MKFNIYELEELKRLVDNQAKEYQDKKDKLSKEHNIPMIIQDQLSFEYGISVELDKEIAKRKAHK